MITRRPPAPRAFPVGLRPQGRPARALPAARRPAGASSGLFGYVFSRFTALAILAILGAHALLGADVHPLPVRVLTAVSAVLLIVEIHRYLQNERRELPFIPLALLQYYATFGFEIFFDLPFYDLSGPVHFTPSARLDGGLAAAVGALGLWAGAQLGLRLGDNLRPLALRALPPATQPTRWDDAFFVYAGIVGALWLISIPFPGVVPQQINVAVYMLFSVELALGLAIVRPPRKIGPRMAEIVAGFGMFLGMMRGQIEPIFRMGMSFTAGRWAVTRKVSLRVILGVVLLFGVVQPVKQSFRDQVWGQSARSGQEVGFRTRVTAWENTLGGAYFSDESRSVSDSQESSISRLSELRAVMHAFMVVPNRVDYLYGESFKQLFYSPIPRVIWPSKPTTETQYTQRYAIIFGRQTEQGSRTTAIGMCVLVEGYWNFGWFGVVLVTLASGVVVGISQRLLAGEHWALRSLAVAQSATLTIGATVAFIFSSLFQSVVARLASTWLIYWLAHLLSERSRRARTPIGLAARARPRP
jgi:hypothetical protein